MRRTVLCVVLVAACAREEARAPSTGTTPPPSANAEPAPVPDTAPTTANPIVDAEPVPPPAPADTVTIIEVDIQAGPLGSQLAAVAKRAANEGRVASVELWAGWCEPCKKLDKLIAAGTVTESLRGSILVRVDVDMFDDELTALGFTAPQIPSFYRLDGKGKPKGKPLSGGDWTRRSGTEIGTLLRDFLAS